LSGLFFIERCATGQCIGNDGVHFFDFDNQMEIHMKTVFLAASLALCMTALPPGMAADEQDAHGDHHKSETTAAASHAGRGKVNSVNLEAGTINLTHDPIKSLKWPKMTMDFKAHDPVLVNHLKPGDQVDFELMKMEGSYHVMKISPSAN
jgi:Cu/Ag efflux protein CusF